jgi:hypothetical protein
LAQSLNSGALSTYFGYLLVLGFIAVGVGVYDYLDQSGHIKHTVETNITAQSNWFVGEIKSCMTTTLPHATAQKKFGNAFEYLSCDDGPPHFVSIEFWGRQEQPEYSNVLWRCTRKETNFVCVEVSGVPK